MSPNSTTAHSVVVGRAEAEVRLSPRDRATHTMIVGSPDSGKTNLLEVLLRQDIRQGHGVCLIDPQGALADRIARYCDYRARPYTLLDCSSDRVAGFNPFRGEGEIPTRVDRIVQAVMKVWGAKTGDETPRLEKWLRCLFTLVIFHRLTILEATLILRRPQLRARLLAELPDSLVKNLLTDLSLSSFREYQNQIESTVNRLLRFDQDSSAGLVLGTDAFPVRTVMDNSGVLIVKLDLLALSGIQQRTLGVLLVNELYETAMARRKGAVPFYLYLDEAGLFATPELGNALDHCRQKGLHITFAFQHLAQFKAEDPTLYKSIKNSALTKVVFRLDDRPDASELADDIFPGLFEPEVKDEIYGLAHRVLDTYLPSLALGLHQSRSSGLSRGKSRTRSRGKGTNMSYAWGNVDGVRDTSDADTAFSSVSTTATRGASRSEGESVGENEGVNEGTAGGWNFGISLVPGVKHEPFQELRSRSYWTLEEKRWRAAEEVMRLPTGRCLVRTKSGELLRVEVPYPRPLPRTDAALHFKQANASALPTKAEARASIEARQRQLLELPEVPRAPAKIPRRTR